MPLRIDPRSLSSDIMTSILAGAFIAVVGRVISTLAVWMGVSEFWAHWDDDIFTGVVAGVILLVALRNNSAKRRLIKKRLNDIAQTNHHVRNALQVIGSSHMAPSEASRLHMVAESVARIERTLREFSVVESSNGNGASRRESAEETEKNVKSKNRE